MTKYRHFVKEIFKLTFGMAIVLTGLSFFHFFTPFFAISWASMGFFLMLTLFSGYYNSRSIKKPFFLNIFLFTLAVTFMASLGFIVAYFLMFDPIKWVIFPIFFFFAVYKAYETIMLVRFSKDLPDIPYPEEYEKK